MITALFYLSVIYILCGLLVQGSGFAESHRVFNNLGFSGYLIFLYVFSYSEGADLIEDIDLSTFVEFAYFAPLLGLGLIGWGWVASTRRAQLERFWLWQWYLVAIPVLLVATGSLGLLYIDWLVAIPMNLIFLAHCVIFILHGSHIANAMLVAIGCLLFSILVVTRFVDLFENLLLRGSIFLILGAGLFVVSNFYSRLRKRDEAERT